MHITPKSATSTRFVSFNVNGVGTFFQYHPWNTLQSSFDRVFELLEADVISLQELKIGSASVAKVGSLNDYRSFVSIPKNKRGYSGVGLFIRSNIPIVKAEEGITGWLKCNGQFYREMETSSDIDKPSTAPTHQSNSDYFIANSSNAFESSSIGSYPSEQEVSKERALELDSQGRCVMVELLGGIIIVSVYCPANSMQTQEGEKYRLDFLSVLLRRLHRLHKRGKTLVLLGDINVSLDLIDNADGIEECIKNKRPAQTVQDHDFETANIDACIDFKLARPSRLLLNHYVHYSWPIASKLPTKLSNCPSRITQPLDPTKIIFNESELQDSSQTKQLYLEYLADTSCQFLYDTTRFKQGRRRAMYTVWNTMTSARQVNYGSRIDLILTNSESLCNSITNADIWPLIKGSDHCPIFTDFKIDFSSAESVNLPASLPFEARKFYKLVKHRDIASMFDKKSVVKSEGSINKNLKRKPQPNLVYVSRKKTAKSQTNSKSQQAISNFFFNSTKSSNVSVTENDEIQSTSTKSTNSSSKLSIDDLSNVYGSQPNCLHGEPCEVKTSLNNPLTRGRKFWCCARVAPSLSSVQNDKQRCNFFKWVEKKK